jgi:hypothetical protein
VYRRPIQRPSRAGQLRTLVASVASAAAGYFDEPRRCGVRNAALYRNLGNTYHLADDLPRALLSYHRGLRLSPNDRALRASLAQLRNRVIFPPSGDLGRPRGDDPPPCLSYLPSG